MLDPATLVGIDVAYRNDASVIVPALVPEARSADDAIAWIEGTVTHLDGEPVELLEWQREAVRRHWGVGAEIDGGAS